MIHGVLGLHLRRQIGCNQKSCGGCQAQTECPFASLFDPRAREDNPLGKAGKIPPPLSLNVHPVGERLKVEINLLGSAKSTQADVDKALQAAGHEGIGRQRSCFEIVGIDWKDYNGLGEKKMVSAGVARNSLLLDFVAPVRLIKDKRLMKVFDPQILVRDLCLRLANWGYNYQSLPWPPPWPEIMAEGRQVKVVDSQLTSTTVDRYSSRQQQRMQLEGITGAVRLAEVGADLARMLRLGTVVHAGKGATIGMGAYKVI